MALMGLGIGSGFPLKIGVGQIVQGDCGRQPEQIADPTKQGVLNRRPMLHQGIRGAIECILGHRFEIHFQQFTQTAALLQPAPRRPFRSRVRHAPNDHPQNDRPQRTRQAQTDQQFNEPHRLHRPQRYLLYPYRARPRQLQGIDVHQLHVGAARGLGGPREVWGNCLVFSPAR
jgi:hypothetical protein